MQVVLRGVQIERRYGVLCQIHAADVTEAYMADGIQSAKLHEFLSREPQPVDMRGVDRLRREKARERRIDKERGEMPGFVYYLRVGERIKIGYSGDVRQRMRAYPPGSQLLAVEPGSPDLELSRHRQFVGSLLDGREWFRPDAPILELVQELVQVHGDPKHHAYHYRKNENPVQVRRTA